MRDGGDMGRIFNKQDMLYVKMRNKLVGAIILLSMTTVAESTTVRLVKKVNSATSVNSTYVANLDGEFQIEQVGTSKRRSYMSFRWKCVDNGKEEIASLTSIRAQGNAKITGGSIYLTGNAQLIFKASRPKFICGTPQLYYYNHLLEESSSILGSVSLFQGSQMYPVYNDQRDIYLQDKWGEWGESDKNGLQFDVADGGLTLQPNEMKTIINNVVGDVVGNIKGSKRNGSLPTLDCFSSNGNSIITSSGTELKPGEQVKCSSQHTGVGETKGELFISVDVR